MIVLAIVVAALLGGLLGGVAGGLIARRALLSKVKVIAYSSERANKASAALEVPLARGGGVGPGAHPARARG